MRFYAGKTVEEAFPHTFKSQLESQQKTLEASRQVMLQARSGSIANIKNWAYLLWTKEFDQLEQFIVLHSD